jgi:hypothetical protein
MQCASLHLAANRHLEDKVARRLLHTSRWDAKNYIATTMT